MTELEKTRNNTEPDKILTDPFELDKAKSRSNPVTSSWWSRSDTYWNDMKLGPFAENAGIEDFNAYVDITRRVLPDWKKFSFGSDLKGTRFEGMASMDVIRELLYAFDKWTASMKGRLPVPDYDIADDRIDNDAEVEFYNMTAHWLYTSIIARDTVQSQRMKLEGVMEENVRVISFRLALIFCAYYHHAFDLPWD